MKPTIASLLAHLRRGAFFSKQLAGLRAMNPLDLITFDSSDFILEGDIEGVRVWHHPSADSITLHYYPMRADLDADLATPNSVRAFYKKLAMGASGGLVEVATPVIEQCRMVRTITRLSLQPPRMIYLGSLLLPFRDFTYAFKIQCTEQGMTGVRESVVFAELMSTGALTVPSISDEQPSGDAIYFRPRSVVGGWMEDPDDLSLETQLMRNRADAEAYDARFPDHPLSRARQLLNRLQKSLRFAPQLRNAPHI